MEELWQGVFGGEGEDHNRRTTTTPPQVVSPLFLLHRITWPSSRRKILLIICKMSSLIMILQVSAKMPTLAL